MIWLAFTSGAFIGALVTALSLTIGVDAALAVGQRIRARRRLTLPGARVVRVGGRR
jgi:hypothetical protein